MVKEKTMYVCSECGQEATKWVGKCPACGEWNTMKEIRLGSAASTLQKSGSAHFLPISSHSSNKPVLVQDIQTDNEVRIDMGDQELNRVLGGGLVEGSLVLLGGEPGIGKSTLVLQTVLHLHDKKVLYVSGEESARQIKLRADRLSGGTTSSKLLLLCETNLEAIYEHISEEQPDLVIIDSIQTIQTEDIDSSPGSLSQIRECAASLLRFAKS